ncbi:MAG: PBP1A family penicillin-binding protein [Geobacteraceae bacterium]|nr:PBP1A family penicillin-binding protein [Geobacteraceae bacterium]
MQTKYLSDLAPVKRFFSKKALAVAISGWLFLSLFASLAEAQGGYVRYPVLSSGYSSIKVFDRERRYVGRIPSEKRYWAPINRIPPFLQKAVVAIEDSRFYEHGGIDMRGIARALVKDVAKGKMAEGGSTITQQLIKNKYLSGEKTLDRKLKEAQLAMDYERRYTKKQILEMYLNEINYGNGAYGIVQAARLYFDKNPEQLTDAECSLLAGVPKNPSRYNPMGPPAAVGARRGLVLRRMQEVGMISRQQERKLRSQRVTIIKAGQAPTYVAHIRNKLKEQYGENIFEQGGLEVIAAMDLKLQKTAEKALSEGVKRLSPGLQGALLCLDPSNGDVLAAVGGVDLKRNSYDRAFYARRQPGSAIKPFIYAAALEKGYTAASFFNDSAVSYPAGNGRVWQPRNYGNEVLGETTLRQALAHSNNVIAVKLLDAVGVPTFTELAGNMGLQLHGRNDLTLALGTEEVTLSELVSAYAPFANGGLRVKPRTIIGIYDRNHRTMSENPSSVEPALSPAIAYVTTQMLKDVMIYGTAKSLKKFSQEHPSAGKTGTTDDYRDAWFVGYTPKVVTGVWVGHDKPRPGGRGFTGGAISAPIWRQFMRSALAGKPALDFQKPEAVVSVRIDPSTGYLATPGCPRQKDEYYVSGTEPTEYCPKHGGGGETAVPGEGGDTGQTPPE